MFCLYENKLTEIGWVSQYGSCFLYSMYFVYQKFFETFREVFSLL